MWISLKSVVNYKKNNRKVQTFCSLISLYELCISRSANKEFFYAMVLIDLCIFVFCHKHPIPMSEESLETVIYHVFELNVKFIIQTSVLTMGYTDHRVET